MSRDPRKDPKPGDVIENGRDRFYVTRVEGTEVYYMDAPPPEEMSVSLEVWRFNSTNDVVIKAVE